MCMRVASCRPMALLLSIWLLPAESAAERLLSECGSGSGEGGSGCEDDDPCARPCGREFSCGDLNRSFTCDALGGLGCDGD